MSAGTTYTTPQASVELAAIVEKLPEISGAVLMVTYPNGRCARFVTQRQGHIVSMLGLTSIVQDDLVANVHVRE